MSPKIKKVARIAFKLVALAPIVAWILIGIISVPLGCTVNEAGAYPCMVGGFNLGPLLHALGDFILLIVFGIPLYAGLLFLLHIISKEKRMSGNDS